MSTSSFAMSPTSKIVWAAVLGAGVRLIWYPQIVVGLGCITAGVLLKLFTNWLGVVVLANLLLLALVLSVLFDVGPVVRALPPAVIARANAAAPRVLQQLARVPLWTVVVAGFGLPALGQLTGSYAVVRTLTLVGATNSLLSTAFFSAVSLCITVLVNVFHALTPAWIRPGKIVFLLQGFWVMRRVLTMSLSDPKQPPLLPLVSTVLIGWGSVVLSSVPDHAVVEAGQAAFVAASAAASAVSSVSSGDVLDAIRWVTATTDSAYQLAAQGAQLVAQTDPRAHAQPLAVEKLLQLNPPLPAAFAVAVLRAVPTCLVLVLAQTATVLQLLLGNAELAQLGLPLVMLPFALAEVFSLLRAIGFRRGVRVLLHSKSITDTDGMSVILWNSPKLAAAWIQFKAADARFGSLSGSLLRALWAPRQVLFPDEEAIRLAPAFDADVRFKLAAAAAVDVIGVSTFAVPVLGEFVDILWAPVSAYLIQRLFGIVGFTFVGFFEELLPFTDVLPTATIAFVWVHGANIPIWLIRSYRAALAARFTALKAD